MTLTVRASLAVSLSIFNSGSSEQFYPRKYTRHIRTVTPRAPNIPQLDLDHHTTQAHAHSLKTWVMEEVA